MIWFSSDFHFDHENIIKYSNRPFKTVEDMNDTIIANCNGLVKKNDDLVFLGDFAFSKSPDRIATLRKLIHCRNFYFILGNHDKVIRKYQRQLEDCFIFLGDYAEEDFWIRRDGGTKNKFVMMHYAMRTWNKSHYGSYHLYGHSHGSLPDDPNSLSFDVGVDCWDFKPISVLQVESVMNKKQWKPIDHHGTRGFDQRSNG